MSGNVYRCRDDRRVAAGTEGRRRHATTTAWASWLRSRLLNAAGVGVGCRPHRPRNDGRYERAAGGPTGPTALVATVGFGDILECAARTGRLVSAGCSPPGRRAACACDRSRERCGPDGVIRELAAAEGPRSPRPSMRSTSRRSRSRCCSRSGIRHEQRWRLPGGRCCRTCTSASRRRSWARSVSMSARRPPPSSGLAPVLGGT